MRRSPPCFARRFSQQVAAVIFDVDGTLTKPVLDFEWLKNRLKRDISSFNEAGDILEQLNGMSPADAKLANTIIHDWETKARESFEFNTGAVQLIRHLDEQGIGRALITRNTQDQIELLNDKLETQHAISPFKVALGREFTPCKPAPDSVLHVCHLLQVEPSQESVLFVGDGLDDLKCAISAGITPVLITNDQHPQQFTRHAKGIPAMNLHTYAFQSLDHLLKEALKKK